MPVIKIECGKLTKEQKKEIIESFSKKLTEITGTPEKFNTVLISEYEDENLGIAGKTVEEIKKEIKK